MCLSFVANGRKNIFLAGIFLSFRWTQQSTRLQQSMNFPRKTEIYGRNLFQSIGTIEYKIFANRMTVTLLKKETNPFPYWVSLLLREFQNTRFWLYQFQIKSENIRRHVIKFAHKENQSPIKLLDLFEWQNIVFPLGGTHKQIKYYKKNTHERRSFSVFVFYMRHQYPSSNWNVCKVNQKWCCSKQNSKSHHVSCTLHIQCYVHSLIDFADLSGVVS